MINGIAVEADKLNGGRHLSLTLDDLRGMMEPNYLNSTMRKRKAAVAEISIKNNVDERPFEKLFSELQKAVKNDNMERKTDLESEIDGLIYQLYGLTEDEIRIVEGKE